MQPKDVAIRVTVDTSDLDAATKKAEHLLALLEQAQSRIEQLSEEGFTDEAGKTDLWEKVGNACLIKAATLLESEPVPSAATVEEVKGLVDAAVQMDMLNLRWSQQKKYSASGKSGGMDLDAVINAVSSACEQSSQVSDVVWTGELVGKMHNAGITAKQLAAQLKKIPSMSPLFSMGTTHLKKQNLNSIRLSANFYRKE